MGFQSLEHSPEVVTGILTVQCHDMYALIDPSSTLSYVTHVAMKLRIYPEHLREPFSVSTLVGECIVHTHVYRDCIVTMHGLDTTTNLIELVMVDFDMIMGIDILYSFFAKLDCQTRTVSLKFPDEPIIEWKGYGVVPKSRFISYLKASKMITCDVSTTWSDSRTQMPRH